MRTLKDLSNLERKKVFLRLDLNVPLKDGKIVDDTRIQGALPTLRYLLEQGARVVIGSHLGRPKGDSEEDRQRYSLEPVAEALAQELGKEVLLTEAPDSDAPKGLMMEAKFDKVILLENLRFHVGEKKNSNELAQKWANYSDIYVNDAFGCCHRADASIDALPKLMNQKAAGFLIEKELEALTKIKEKPERPFVVILGGSKVSDKIGVIESFLDVADTILIGGAMAYTFLKAEGIAVGNSLVEEDKLSIARDFIKRFEARDKQILLPIDHVISEKFAQVEGYKVTSGQMIESGWMGLDIGPQTRGRFAQVIANAKSIFWNGPMGVYETAPFNEGSFAVAEAVAKSSAYSVIGGGDSAAATVESGYADQVSHISTGGGASLEFMEGKILPGLRALK